MTSLTLSPTCKTIAADGRRTPLDIPEDEFIAAYKAHGALLMRGFSLDLDVFAALTQRYCSGSVFNESPGRETLEHRRNIQTVNLGTEAFPLHPELSREPWKPDVCFFWCMSPPANGGETTFCDGVEIVRNLPREAYDALRQRRLRYTLPASPAVLQFWLGTPDPSEALLARPPGDTPYQFSRVNGRIMRSFTRPALHKPMFTDELAFGNFLLFGRYLNGVRNFPTFENGELVSDALLAQVKAASDPITTAVDWREGDVLVLDNTRFMHGRRAITDVAERRIATHFGFLRFATPDPEEGVDPPWRRGDFHPPPN
jgi:hypothetical protein